MFMSSVDKISNLDKRITRLEVILSKYVLKTNESMENRVENLEIVVAEFISQTNDVLKGIKEELQTLKEEKKDN